MDPVYLYLQLAKWLKVCPNSARRTGDINWLILIVITIFDSNQIVRVKRTVFSVTSEKMKVLHSVEYYSNAANEVLKLNENNREANREASLHTKEAIFDDL